ncbi:MAG: site-specific integrase [Candidatus Methanofastidiosa archaeon]|nr:site-specific integrase [Candidatus Methanofastidiosa archaeon]
MHNPNGYGSVYKAKGRRRKPWVARVTTGWTTAIATKGKNKGKEVPRQLRQIIGCFTTKQEALDALALHRISPVSPKANMTLGEIYREWSENKYKNISKSTENNYRAAWNYLKTMEGAKFKDLRTTHWQNIINRCVADNLSQSTLKKIKTVAVMLCRYGMQNDIINKNYAEYTTLPKDKKREQEIFTDAHIKKMFDNAETVPWVDTILIMIYTGMRISEMLALTKFSVDLQEKIIVGGLKTEAGKGRIIPIHPKIFPFIKKWYAKNGEALICRENGKKMSAKYYRENYYYPVLEQLEIKRLTPHTCRHTFASLMARAKAEPLHIQRIIGHTDYAFTANKYTHPEIIELRKAIEKI